MIANRQHELRQQFENDRIIVYGQDLHVDLQKTKIRATTQVYL
jgi:hypothetical protein